VIGISQSGSSPDVKAVIEEARRQGRPTIAITNDPGSPLGTGAEAVLPLEAGEERAVAATKTYLSSLGAVALLFAVSTADGCALDELRRMPDQVAAQLDLSAAELHRLDGYGSIEGGTVVARGIDYGTSFSRSASCRVCSSRPTRPPT
jgi:glucosamine--fructose-6-phosphate aminotransferase (isomerizing)